MWIASWNNDWQIREDSEKDEDGSLKYPLKVRKELVDDAICRTLALTAASIPFYLETAERILTAHSIALAQATAA